MKYLYIFLSLFFCCNIAGFTVSAEDAKPPRLITSYELRSGQPIANVSGGQGNIKITFNAQENNILITVSDETGMPVYEDKISTVKGDCITISSGSGVHLVTITDAQGNILHQDTAECY